MVAAAAVELSTELRRGHRDGPPTGNHFGPVASAILATSRGPTDAPCIRGLSVLSITLGPVVAEIGGRAPA